MSKKVEISKVILTVGKHEFSLTVQEAKELKEALEQLFPEPKTHTVYVDRYPVPYYRTSPYLWGSTSWNVSLCSNSETSANGSQSNLLGQ